MTDDIGQEVNIGDYVITQTKKYRSTIIVPVTAIHKNGVVVAIDQLDCSYYASHYNSGPRKERFLAGDFEEEREKHMSFIKASDDQIQHYKISRRKYRYDSFMKIFSEES